MGIPSSAIRSMSGARIRLRRSFATSRMGGDHPGSYLVGCRQSHKGKWQDVLQGVKEPWPEEPSRVHHAFPKEPTQKNRYQDAGYARRNAADVVCESEEDGGHPNSIGSSHHFMMMKGRKASIGFQRQLSRISEPNRLTFAQSSHRGTAPVSSNEKISPNEDASRVTAHAMASVDLEEISAGRERSLGVAIDPTSHGLFVEHPLTNTPVERHVVDMYHTSVHVRQIEFSAASIDAGAGVPQ